MTAKSRQPITVLIAALGGEGGGVLADWIVTAAGAEGYPVQSTSIPGVAQRTGATTYYIEVFPVPVAELDGREPVLALTPSPANVDVMVASELLEAGRAMQNGLVTPDRTTLIASTHRIFAVTEKSAMADGRFDGERIFRAAAALAREAVLFDMASIAREAGSVINAVILGAIAASGRLPIGREAFEAAIRGSAIAVEANLAGFAAGVTAAASSGGIQGHGAAVKTAGPAVLPLTLGERVERNFPDQVRPVVEAGIARLVDYQDEAYGRLYLEQLASILALDGEQGGEARGYELTAECARHLALWMTYEDVIRVADLKTRAARHARVRLEVGAKPDEPVRVIEFLKPGVEEFTSVMPRPVARTIQWIARRLGRGKGFNVGLRIPTTSVSGFGVLYLLAKLKRFRRRTLRYADEQARIARWLDAVGRAARQDYALALEVVDCARLIKGYGDTYHRGVANFETIMETVVSAELAGRVSPDAAATVARAREAALADPDGETLAGVLGAMRARGREAEPAEERLAEAGD